MDTQKTTSGPTIRFNLSLSQPTDDHYNEFSYAKLVSDLDKKKQEQNPQEDASDDQKLVALAKKFEEKYGPKNKRMIRDRDYMDIGYGYDSEDSFVDDSEAYDEFVPHSLDTKHGGFYINTGDLEFKDSEEADPDEVDFKPKKVPIKKTLSGTPQTILASKKIKLAKQRKAMMQNPQATTNLKVKVVRKIPIEKSQLVHTKMAEGLTPVNKIGSNISNSTQILSSLLQGSSLDKPATASQTPLFTNASNSGMSSSTNVSPSENLLNHILTGSLAAKTEMSGQKSSSTGNINNKPGESVVAIPKVKPLLPDGLPESLLSKITLLEMNIAKDAGDSKLTNKMRTQYDGHIVEIDQLARQLGLKMKVAVFEYVAYILGVSKQTLMGKIKKAIRKKEDIKIKIAMDALQKAIDVRMPALLSKHEENIKALGLNTTSESLKGSEEDSTSDLVVDLGQGNSTTTESQDSKPRRIRKTFHWDEEMRALLYDVMSKKINAELAVQKKVTNWEEILTDFIDNEVKLLWPKGWMPKSVLLKISEPVCKPYTSQQDNKSAGALATTSTIVTTKKVVKQSKEVTVKKEALTAKSKPLPPPTPTSTTTITTSTVATATTTATAAAVTVASLQSTSSTATSVTSAASRVKLTTSTLPVTKLIVAPPPATKSKAPPLPVFKNTPPLPPVTKSTVAPPPPATKSKVAPPLSVFKSTTPPPPATETIAPPLPVLKSTPSLPSVTKNTLPEHGISTNPIKHTFVPPVTKHTTVAPSATKYAALTVGNVLQSRPLMTSSTNLLVSSNTMPHPVVMTIPGVQLDTMLAMSRPIVHLTTGEGSQIHSNTQAMSLPPQSIIPTTLVNQQHNKAPLQLPSSNFSNNLPSISTTTSTIMRTSEMTTSSSNNHQVLQEHSYQRAENVQLTFSNSSPSNKTTVSDQPVPKFFVTPMNPPFK